MTARRAAPILFFAAAALVPMPVLAQAANGPLEQRYDAVRAGLVAAPEQGLAQSVALEREATLRDGANSRLAAASIAWNCA